MNEYVQGVDLSHWQGRPDFGKLLTAGTRFIIAKATERMGVDPDFVWLRNQAERNALPCLAYTFLRPDDTNATIDHFLSVTEGMVPALDWEVDKLGMNIPAAVLERWMDRCEAKLNRRGLAYYGLYPPALATTKIASWPRWYAQYPLNPNTSPRISPWSGEEAPDWRERWLIWQYSGTATIPGLPGEFDLNRLAPECSLDMFEHWIKTGELKKILTPVPTPTPKPKPRNLRLHSTGDDVRVLQSRLDVLGFLNDFADGDFGPKTYAAVIAAQRSFKLDADGIVGPKTRAALEI